MSSWYVLQCKVRQEQRAQLNVENQAYVTCLPTMMVTKRVAGKRQSVREPVFPGYLFVQIDLETANFNALRSTRGVYGFVRFGGVPAQIPSQVIEQLQALEEQAEQQPVSTGLFSAGTVVEVTDGPFVGLKAVYQLPKGEDRCLVLLDMLGKQQRIEIEERLLKGAS